MSNIRDAVLGYVRDSYLGSTVHLNPDLPVVDCAIGSSQWGMSAKAIDAHRSFDVASLVGYFDLFHDRLARKLYERFGIKKEDAPVFFGHGSFNLAERLIHKFISPTVMVGVGPQFNEIPSEFVAAGGQYRPMSFRGAAYEFPVAEIKAAIRQGASVVYIDNPNNPTGALVPLDVIATIAATAEKCGTLLIVDEAYGDFVDDACSAAHLVPTFGNIAVLRSFSKALGLAAARVGYMFLSSGIAGSYRHLDVPFEPTLHSAELAYATLEDVDFIRGVRTLVGESKSVLVPVLREQGFNILPTHPQTSIVSVHLDDGDVVQTFASIAVTVEPGSAFAKTNSDWDDSYCRIRLPKKEVLPELIKRIRSLRTTCNRSTKRHAHQS